MKRGHNYWMGSIGSHQLPNKMTNSQEEGTGIYQQPSVMCPTGKVHVKNTYKDFISFKSPELWLRKVVIAKALSTSPFTIFVIALLITDQTVCGTQCSGMHCFLQLI